MQKLYKLYIGQNCKKKVPLEQILTMLGLLDCSIVVGWSGAEDDEQEEESVGAQTGNGGKLGEAGSEWLLTRGFGTMWGSQHSPLTEKRKKRNYSSVGIDPSETKLVEVALPAGLLGSELS